MAISNFAYDHPAYLTRFAAGSQTTPGNTTVSNRFVAFTDMIARSAQVTVIVAGTSATTGHVITVQKVSGTTTTALATATLGTSVIGVTTNLDLANTALAPGDLLISRSGTDATGAAAVSYELSIRSGANLNI